MQPNSSEFLERTRKYTTQSPCLKELNWCCWKNGLICPKCEHDQSCQFKCRHLYKRTDCDRQVSLSAGTIFEYAQVLLTTWFLVTYLREVQKRYSGSAAFGEVQRGLAVHIVDRAHLEQNRQFAKQNSSNSVVCTDAFQAILGLGEAHRYFLEYIREFVFSFSITDSGNHSCLKGGYRRWSTMCWSALPQMIVRCILK